MIMYVISTKKNFLCFVYNFKKIASRNHQYYAHRKLSKMYYQIKAPCTIKILDGKEAESFLYQSFENDRKVRNVCKFCLIYNL